MINVRVPPPPPPASTAAAVPAANTAAVVPSPQTRAELLFAEFCRRFFSEARVAARAKFWTFTAFLGFIGLGFTLRVGDLRLAEFILASPDVAAILGGLAAFCCVIGANLYSRLRTNDTRLRLYELAANPSTPQDVRDLLLSELAKS